MSDLLLMGGGRGSYGESFVYAGNLEFEVSSSQSSPTLPLNLSSEGTYDFTIDWGDGSSDVITAYDQPETSHQYSSTGTYPISISGQIDNTPFFTANTAFNLNSVSAWGNFQLDTSGTFANLTIANNPVLAPYTGNVQNYRRAFERTNPKIYNAAGGNSIIDLNGWDTSNATSLEGIFASAKFGNVLISNWDVSSVTDMSYAFFDARSDSAINISNWDVSNVTNFQDTFSFTYSSLSVSDITGWDTSSATNMTNMFKLAHNFNQNISTWNVSNVQSFENMFSQNFGFNQPIGSWDMSSATTIAGMFFLGSVFNQPIGNWNTSNVQSFAGVFGNLFTNVKTPFNQDISNWDFTGCLDSDSMLYIFGLGIAGYTAFCNMSQANYEALLISWASQAANMPTGMRNIDSDFVYGAGSAAEAARTTLVSTYGWTITDGGAV